jgi:DNA-binding NarL/FixJ family response regulator
MFGGVDDIADLQTIRSLFTTFEYPSDLPVFPPQMRDLVQLLAQGKNQREAADILGVTEGMISLRVKEIRTYLIEQHKMGFSYW